MRVAMWSGSLGSPSANTAALEVAARWLAQGGADVEWIHGLEQVPPFRADLVDEPPTVVGGMRFQIEKADAVLIAAPEYAGGLAGLAKNALDWLVGSGSLYHKLVGVLSAGTTGGEFARAQLIRTLAWQGAITVADCGIVAPRNKMRNDEFTDRRTISAIEGWAAEVVIANRLSHDQRVLRAAPILEPLGIDGARFGQSRS